MKAYFVQMRNSSMIGLVAANTRGKAIYHEMLQARCVGLYLPFTEFRATRAPEYDKFIPKNGYTYTPLSLGWKDGDEMMGAFLGE